MLLFTLTAINSILCHSPPGGFDRGKGPGAPNSTSRLIHGGAGHGGTGGRGSCDGLTYCISRKGLPYGSTFRPTMFGSGGDGTGGKGGGVIYIETDRLQVHAKYYSSSEVCLFFAVLDRIFHVFHNICTNLVWSGK